VAIKMTNEEYIEKQKYIWDNYVPARGQSEYVQGELYRALVKLEREATRGNVNWDDGFETLAIYLRDTVEEYNILNEQEFKAFKNDVERLLIYTEPYLEDDIYKRIAHVIVDFYIKYPEPIKRKINPHLHR